MFIWKEHSKQVQIISIQISALAELHCSERHKRLELQKSGFFLCGMLGKELRMIQKGKMK